MGQKANKDRFKQSISFDKWMADAIQEIADKKGLTFTSVVQELLRQELNFMGYSMGIGREATESQTMKDTESKVKKPKRPSNKELASNGIAI